MTVNQILAPVRVVLTLQYWLLYGVSYVLIGAIVWCARRVVKLTKAYFHLAYRWQPKTMRAQARYEVSPYFDASVVVLVLLAAGAYTFAQF